MTTGREREGSRGSNDGDDAALDALLGAALRAEDRSAGNNALQVTGLDPVTRIERRIATIEGGRLHRGEMLLVTAAVLGCLALGSPRLGAILPAAASLASAWFLTAGAAIVIALLDRVAARRPFGSTRPPGGPPRAH